MKEQQIFKLNPFKISNMKKIPAVTSFDIKEEVSANARNREQNYKN